MKDIHRTVQCSCYNLTNYNIGKTLADKENHQVGDNNSLSRHICPGCPGCPGSSSRTGHAEAERRERTEVNLVASPPPELQFCSIYISIFQFAGCLCSLLGF